MTLSLTSLSLTHQGDKLLKYCVLGVLAIVSQLLLYQKSNKVTNTASFLKCTVEPLIKDTSNKGHTLKSPLI